MRPPETGSFLTIPPTWAIRLKPLLVQCPEWGLRKDHTDCQTLYSASVQSEPLQHCLHLSRASHHARDASQNPLNAYMHARSKCCIKCNSNLLIPHEWATRAQISAGTFSSSGPILRLRTADWRSTLIAIATRLFSEFYLPVPTERQRVLKALALPNTDS